MSQLMLEFAPPPCEHSCCFMSLASVPPTLVCVHCSKALWQRLPPLFDEPLTLGYVTADWAWHWRDGKPWTTL